MTSVAELRNRIGARGPRLRAWAASLLLALAAFAGLGTTAATARNQFSLDHEIREVRGWTIAANKARGACLAFATYRSQTVVEYGYDAGSDDFFILFANEAWTNVRAGAPYEGQLLFDGGRRWSGHATGIVSGSLYGYTFEKIAVAFMKDLARYSSGEFRIGGRRLDGFSFDGTWAALQAVIDCTRDVQAGRIVIPDEEPDEADASPEPARRDDKTATDRARDDKSAGSDKDDKSGKDEKTVSLSTGTGFFVDAEGHLVTNAHVVTDCTQTMVKLPDGRTVEANVLARSRQNDLAVLKVDTASPDHARFRGGPSIRLGDSVVVFGYPLAGELTVTGNLTTGLVSAMAGPGEDVTRMQISAQVQSGNSGGAVVDRSGRVVGVVVSKSDTMPRAKGDVEVLQNVNFAIRSGVLLYFLDANRIAYATDTVDAEKSIADVADQARRFSGLVICREK